MRAESEGRPRSGGTGAVRGAGGGGARRGAFLVPALGAVLACGAALACGDDGAAAVDRGRPDDVPERRLLGARWDTLFRVGGGREDTLFLQATRIGADDGGVSLVDGYSGRVLRFDTAGRLAWSYGGRGAGPDEFRRPRDLDVDARGRTWVLDVLNARITVVGADGRAAFRIPLDEVDRPVDAMAPLPGDRAVLFALDGEAPFVTVEATGSVGGAGEVPWPGFARLNRLATQMKLASGGASGTWAAAFAFGDPFFLFGAAGAPVARGWLPQPVPFPGVTVRTSGSAAGRRRRTTRVERPRIAAVSLAMSEERLYVLFGGEGERANRWVDSYAAADGSYAGSYLLPEPAGGIAHGGGVLYVRHEDPYPALTALRPRGERAP